MNMTKNETTKEKEVAGFDYPTLRAGGNSWLDRWQGPDRPSGGVDRDDRALAERGLRGRDGCPPRV